MMQMLMKKKKKKKKKKSPRKVLRKVLRNRKLEAVPRRLMQPLTTWLML
jgi:hypothetical protein